MTSPTETAALVALLRSGKKPWSVYAELVEEAGSALAVLEQEAGATLFANHDLASAEGEIGAWRHKGIQVLTLLDAKFPENLRAAHDRPPLIFVAGQLRESDARAVAVVGARQASAPGIEAARKIAAELVDNGFTVASGLAAGIDTAAHKSALERRGRTIAVIGTGLLRSYPPENAPLQRRIADEGGVISQFWPDAPPSKRSFPMRNALMSGLSLATVVVEAAHTSGARLQARLALAHGRPVFMADSLLAQEWAREHASRPGTHVFREPREIIATLQRLTHPGALTA